MYAHAKEEFLGFIKTHNSPVLCATVTVEDRKGNVIKANLKGFWTKEAFDDFLNQIDVTYYYRNYGEELNLNGYIWFLDGSWGERTTEGNPDYEGMEGWELRTPPEIPEDLKNNAGSFPESLY